MRYLVFLQIALTLLIPVLYVSVDPGHDIASASSGLLFVDLGLYAAEFAMLIAIAVRIRWAWLGYALLLFAVNVIYGGVTSSSDASSLLFKAADVLTSLHLVVAGSIITLALTVQERGALRPAGY